MWLRSILRGGGRDVAVPPLDEQGRVELAAALGDTPETVIPVHMLRRGLCDAYVYGEPSTFACAVIRSANNPREVTAFGEDAGLLWRLLGSISGWAVVNVPVSCARALGAIIEGETGAGVRYLEDVYHTLRRPIRGYPNETVRTLVAGDVPMLEASPPELQGAGFESTLSMLEEGAAGAIVSRELVAIVHVYALSERHADMGVYTLEEWRGRGFATAAASIVAERVRESGRIPVWSAGENNPASLRVAEKLGFAEVSRRVYVVRE